MKQKNCPCGSGKKFAKCCELYISGKQLAPSPEKLMRSRYSAYSIGNIDYIQSTMCGPASIDFNAAEALRWSTECNWLSLRVMKAYLENPNKGFVEFIARYRIHNQNHKIHELSEFHCIDNRWFYVDGKML